MGLGTNSKYDVTLSIGLVSKDLNSQLAAARKNVKRSLMTGVGVSPALKNFQEIEGTVNRLNKVIKPARMEFAGWALSIMFAGMALQRMFGTIRKFGLKAFQDINHSVEGSTTGFDMLQGSMKYLGFTVGQALEPITTFLLPIVDGIADWIFENQGLTASIISIGTVLGGLFAVGGMAVLAVNGFAELALNAGWYTKEATGALKATEGFSASLKALRVAAGIGILVVVGMRIFGKEGKPTAADWFTNLGMATSAGWMLGGAWGAAAAFIITGVVMIAKEDARKALQQVQFIKDASDKIMRGEVVNIAEAVAIQWQGTVVPQYVQDLQKEKMSSALVGAGVTSQSQHDLLYGPPITQLGGQPLNITLTLDPSQTNNLLNGEQIITEYNANN